MSKISIIGLSGNSIFYDIDNLPKKGETIKASNIHFELGGKGMNQAIAAKRLGLDVNYLSAIGDDIYGDECIKLMEQENIHSTFIKKDVNTACASILKANDSSNEVIVFQGANELLNTSDLNMFKKDIIESDMVLLTYEIPYNVLKEAIKIAKENNVKIVLNPAPYVYNDIELLKSADIITPNEVEANMIFNTLDSKVIQSKVKEYGLSKVVITLGDKGSLVFDNNKIEEIKSIKVNAIDTTGAGDIFNAALCKKLLEGEDLINSCEYANIVSAISVTRKYVINSIPNVNEVNDFIKNEK